MNFFPCTLVYVDLDASPGPNATNRDPLSYVSQAICLNSSLRKVGMPTLTIMSNAPAEVARRLDSMAPENRPALMRLNATIELSKGTPFYAAHFKLDLLVQVAGVLPADTMLLLLDTDMVAMRPLEQKLIGRCAEAGRAAFDICWNCPEVEYADRRQVEGSPMRHPTVPFKDGHDHGIQL